MLITEQFVFQSPYQKAQEGFSELADDALHAEFPRIQSRTSASGFCRELRLQVDYDIDRNCTLDYTLNHQIKRLIIFVGDYFCDQQARPCETCDPK
ncbi:hypothetical protein TH5_16430 [Thalassospira xianhensis MCCC 1A02616]|uniref:Uncharacterized protein n=1 Tax=Thalassospira xianhensis MCCC 1A02616 TaxID=1177929 RepID=A0A367U9H6_9PROT|nr:hypothetical protein TH5_16430 [Thalassospira xianhensis MCCC 1A02616]